MIFVSGCLVGINCKYNGGNNFNEKIFNMVIDILKNEDITEKQFQFAPSN